MYDKDFFIWLDKRRKVRKITRFLNKYIICCYKKRFFQNLKRQYIQSKNIDLILIKMSKKEVFNKIKFQKNNTNYNILYDKIDNQFLKYNMEIPYSILLWMQEDLYIIH